PSLFERVFLDKRVAAPTDATFKLVFDDGSPTANIESVRAGLAAALRVSAIELALLTDPTAADLALRLLPIAQSTDIVAIGNLSRLYRVVSFARAARISLPELMLLRELSGENVLTGDSGAPATPDGTLAFLDTVERAKALPMPLEEIHYVLRHVAAEGSPLLLDPEEDLKPWREELEELVKAAAGEAEQIVDSNGSVLRALAENLVEAGLMTNDDLDYLKMLVLEPANMGTAPVPTADAFITNTLAPFLAGAADPVAHAKTFLKITPPPIPPVIPDAELPGRYTYLAQRFQLYLSTRVIVRDWVAQKFQIDPDVAAQLVAGNVLAFGALPAINAFVPRTTWNTPEGTAQTREDLLVRLQKAAIFARRFTLAAEEVAAFYPASGALLPQVDFNALPIIPPASAGPIAASVQSDFDALLDIGDIIALRDKWAAGSKSLFAVIKLAAEGATIQSVIAAASLSAGWVQSDVDALRGVALLDLDVPSFASGAALVRLDKALAVVKRLGVPAAFLEHWINVDIAIPLVTNDAGPNAVTVGREIRRAARAKHDNDSWTSVARPLRNALREKQRNALVGHLIAQSSALKSPEDLYANLLIDVQMDPCALTSRLVLAHSSCQLFIQRIQMNLESGAGLSPNRYLALEWDWMKNYRVWEANRKVFLWPENWIEPDLRDDKSPLFKDLERTLLSGPIDNAAAEEAYRAYLDGLADLSNLEIVAMHVEERRNDDAIVHLRHSVVLHVFGRTRKSHVYYYRRRELGSWTPWEKVDAPIEGDHLMPFAYGGRLYLAWAVMEETDRQPREIDDEIETDEAKLKKQQTRLVQKIVKATAQERWDLVRSFIKALGAVNEALKEAQNEAAKHPPVELSVKLAVSELRAGAWTAPLESEAQLLGASPPKASLSFRTEIGSDGVRITMVVVGTVYDDATGDDPADGASDVTARALKFTFYPGTSSHTVEAPLAVLVDSTGLYQSQLMPEIDPPVPVDLVTPPYTGTGGSGGYKRFTQTAYQAFAAPESGSLRLWLMQNGASYPLAKILDSGVTKRTRIVADRITEPGKERGFLIMQDAQRCFTLELGNRKPGQTQLSFSPPTSYAENLPDGDREYRFDLFYHPYVNGFRHVVASHGLDALLRPVLQAQDGLQYATEDLTTLASSPYVPFELNVEQSHPYFLEEVDFRHGSAFGVYNWELFFHIPLMIADHLSSEGRHDEAQRWLHSIFDPTDGTPGQGPERYWKFKPFAENKDLATIQEELENLTANTYAQQMQVIMGVDTDSATAQVLSEQIEAWRRNPFEPHLLARMRTVAYQKTVVMRYIENLIAWGDKLFARDSIESINEATQLYILALEILGPKPTLIPDPAPPTPQSYDELDTLSAFDAFSNALVAMEVLAPVQSKYSGSQCGSRLPPPKIVWGSPYFCVPPNEKLLGYWDTVADRLFKIRNCMNIEGAVRTLPLFEPPIDPALLVRAKAAGVDLSSVLFDISAAAPPYRYGVLYGKAVEIASSVANLGATLLSALEKHDGELLAEMRQRHEVATQQAILETRRAQVKEAQESLRATERSLALAKERFEYYSTRETINAAEQYALELQQESISANLTAQDFHMSSSVAALIPNLTFGISGPAGSPVNTLAYGGSNASSFHGAVAGFHGAVASSHSTMSGIVGTTAGYRRRKDDWDHQTKLARLEIVQIERQIEAARIRLEIAKSEVATVQRQIAQSQEVERFLQRKFTNEELYGWMKVEVAKVYYQAYKLAYEMAKRAEKAFQFERGDVDDTFIQFGYWDSFKKGLLAGERLLQDLRRMDAAYLANNKRELELMKMVSLAEHDPDELVALRETGVANIRLTEDDYDRDFWTKSGSEITSHSLRRLKAVTVSVPCTAGPYQGVHGTLELLGGATRRPDGNIDFSPTAIQSICTSQAQQDSGLFELQFRDERFLPFEGVGAHAPGESAQWRFSLSRGNRFEYKTIDDLVLDVRYTARLGRKITAPFEPRALKRLIRVPRDFGLSWRAYLQGDANAEIEMALPMSGWTRGHNETSPTVTKVTVYGWWKAGTPTAPTFNTPAGPLTLTGADVADYRAKIWSSASSYTLDAEQQLWKIKPTPALKSSLTDLWIVFEYTVTVS
ncbi:MAG: hypothetical protein HOW73_34605, partial [Polyangiaceae bacterium]|nr:hypothetical protein [Polyangiaceae bacterium]